MGIKGFFKVLVANSKHPKNGEPISEIGESMDLDNLSGTKVAIDASGIIYNSLTAFASISSLTDSNGEPTGHILRIINMANSLKSKNILQYWVFDSPKQTPLKAETNKKRNVQRAYAAEKGTKGSFKLTSKIVNEVKELLLNMGIPIFQAPDEIEGEKYAAFLASGTFANSFCKYVISADSDVLMFGGNLLRYVSESSASGKSKKTVYKSYTLESVLNAFACSYEELVNICLALGTDFNEKTPRVGPKTVVDKVQYNEIEYTERQNQAREYIMSKVNITPNDMIVKPFDGEELRKFLSSKNFAEKTIVKTIEQFSS